MGERRKNLYNPAGKQFICLSNRIYRSLIIRVAHGRSTEADTYHVFSQKRKKTRVRGALITGKRCGVKIFWKDERKVEKKANGRWRRKHSCTNKLVMTEGSGGGERKVWGKTSPQTVTSAQLCWSRLAAVAPAWHTHTHTRLKLVAWNRDVNRSSLTKSRADFSTLLKEMRCRFSHCTDILIWNGVRVWHGALQKILKWFKAEFKKMFGLSWADEDFSFSLLA